MPQSEAALGMTCLPEDSAQEPQKHTHTHTRVQLMRNFTERLHESHNEKYISAPVGPCVCVIVFVTEDGGLMIIASSVSGN